MKFQVPQFIDMEDKIFGPLSFKEFIYLAGGAGLSYIFYRYIPSFYLALIFIIPIMAFALALAFYKVNNKPFIEIVQSAIIFAIGKKLYIWKKEPRPLSEKEKNSGSSFGRASGAPAVRSSKLTNIGFDLDVNSKSEQPKNLNDSLNIKI